MEEGITESNWKLVNDLVNEKVIIKIILFIRIAKRNKLKNLNKFYYLPTNDSKTCNKFIMNRKKD